MCDIIMAKIVYIPLSNRIAQSKVKNGLRLTCSSRCICLAWAWSGDYYLSNKNIKQWVQYQVNVCVIVLHRWTVVIWVYKKLKLTYWTSHPCFIFQSWRPNVWNRFLICVTFFITNKGKKKLLKESANKMYMYVELYYLQKSSTASTQPKRHSGKTK